jgi:galactoside O-acetyltransferase
MSSFYSERELKKIGFAKFGKNILISRKASIYMPENIYLGSNIRIDDFSVIVGGKKEGIRIGNYVHIACFCGLFGASGIYVEDFCGLSSRVTIYSESDDYNGNSHTNPMIPVEYKPTYVTGHVILRKHSIIGAHSIILPTVTIGEGAAVGAGSLVMKNCDDWSVYFGSPAKKIKERSRKLLELEKKFKADFVK